MDNLNASKFLIGDDGKDPFNYDDMHENPQPLETKPTLEEEIYVSEDEIPQPDESKNEDDLSEEEGDNSMGGNSIMILALLIGAFLFMRKK